MLWDLNFLLSGRGGGRGGEGVNGTNDSIVQYLLSKFDQSSF